MTRRAAGSVGEKSIAAPARPAQVRAADERPVASAPAAPTPGRYTHYKGGQYRVVGLARHSETLEPLVVYEALYGAGGLWVRPAAMFTEEVTIGGVRQPRFRRLPEA